jgi:hypothetical protein
VQAKNGAAQVAHDGRLEELRCMIEDRGVRPEMLTGKAGATLLHVR